MADAAPKEKKKKKTEGKKSEQASAKKSDANSVDAKEKAGGRKASATPAATEADKTPSVTSDKGRKPSTTPDPGRKPSATPDTAPKPSATSDKGRKPSTTPDPGRKPSATPDTAPKTSDIPNDVKGEVSADEAPTSQPQPVLKVSGSEAEVNESPAPKSAEETKESEGDSQRLQPGGLEEEPPEPQRKGSYVAPKAATRRDVELLYDLDNQKIAELKEAFHLFDLNNDGFIDKDDLKNTYITLGKEDVRDEEIQHMLSEAMNPLDFDAFVILLGYKTIELDPEEVLREALSQWDYDESGLISEERIKHDLMMWGDRFTTEEVEMALEDAPVFLHKVTGVAMIDYVKFCKVLCGLRKKPKPQPEE